LAGGGTAVKHGVVVVQARARNVGKVVICGAFLGILQALEIIVKVVKGALGGRRLALVTRGWQRAGTKDVICV
jgi:hypothetical protein